MNVERCYAQAMLDDFCARGLQFPESTTTRKPSRVRNNSEWYHIAGEAQELSDHSAFPSVASPQQVVTCRFCSGASGNTSLAHVT